MASIQGRCACGQVRIELLAEPSGPYQCYCRQCRRASGGGPATFVMAPRAAVRLEGETRRYAEPTLSGRSPSRSFCPTSGTAILSELDRLPDALIIKLSVLEDGPWKEVQAIFWTSEAPAWAHSTPGVRAFEEQP